MYEYFTVNSAHFQYMDWMTKMIRENWDEVEARKMDVHVRRRKEGMRKFVAKHKGKVPKISGRRDPEVNPAHDWAYAAQLLVGNSINFGFNEPNMPGGRYRVANRQDQQNPFIGARAMWRKLFLEYGDRVPHARDIEAITPSLFSASLTAMFFRDLTDIPLPELRAQCLKDLIEGLERDFGGNPLNIFEEAMVWNDVEKRWELPCYNGGRGLVEILIRCFPFAYGSDDYMLHGMRFPFYKKARLVPIMLLGRTVDFGGKLPTIPDIEEVGPIMDYKLPQFNEHEGNVEYSRGLKEKIERLEEVSSGSEPEIHVRACNTAVNAEIAEELACTYAELDQYQFVLSRGLPTKPHIPRGKDY